MAIKIDPERREIAALGGVAEWRGAHVLEVGCGDGRLTLRLAGLGARVTALDAERSLIRQARQALPKAYSKQVRYYVGSASRLRHPSESFDVVVFAWSL